MSQPNPIVPSNGHDRPLSIVIEDDPSQEQHGGAFYDSSNPLLAPPKQVDLTRKKGRKRKLLTYCFILLVVFAGVGALYLLLRVNRVNVSVQADSRRDEQTRSNNKADSRNSESSLTAEAINLTRQAVGADRTTSNPASSPSPSASPANSPSSGSAGHPNYSATDKSPAYEQTGTGDYNSGSSQSQNAAAQSGQPRIATENAMNDSAQSHANVTHTIVVDESLAKPASAPRTPATSQLAGRDEKRTSPKANETVAVLPPFGTMLPVRTQGVIFTLRNNAYARLELARDAAGPGWSLPKGTVLIGRVNGSEFDRAFISVNGYLDPRDNKLVKLDGEVLGSDGASGIQGKQVVMNQEGLKRALRKVASSGLQVAGMMAGALTGRGAVVIDSAGYRLMNPLTDEAGRMVGARANEKRTFVKVDAGRPGYVMVADLPKSAQAIDAPGEDELGRAAISLTDREVMELILFGAPEEIQAALPLMTDEQKRLALKAQSAGAKK